MINISEHFTLVLIICAAAALLGGGLLFGGTAQVLGGPDRSNRIAAALGALVLFVVYGWIIFNMAMIAYG